MVLDDAVYSVVQIAPGSISLVKVFTGLWSFFSFAFSTNCIGISHLFFLVVVCVPALLVGGLERAKKPRLMPGLFYPDRRDCASGLVRD